MTYNIYLAAPWTRKADAINARFILEKGGFHVTSRWLDVEEDGTPEQLHREAIHDWEDLCNSCAMILLNLEKSEGKAVETGIALARHIPIYLVGDRTNVFHHLPCVRVFRTLPEALAQIKKDCAHDAGIRCKG